MFAHKKKRILMNLLLFFRQCTHHAKGPEKKTVVKKFFPRQRSLKFYSLEKKTASAMQIGHA
jgi:hypothetical protein